MRGRQMIKCVILVTVLACAVPLAGHDQKTLATLPPHARETALTALQWTDQYWDARSGFLWDTRTDVGAQQGDARRHHAVRDTIWYAVGLMLRDQAGDRTRSLQAIAGVLSQQLDDAAQPYSGTFYRSPEELHPPARGAQPFGQYDPNWREFVGTTLAILLEEYPDRLPAALRTQMEHAIARAISGEIAEARLKPDYSNIALMHGFLWSWAGKRFERPDWSRDGRRFAGEVFRLFNQHETFEEYNSPTYYGVDLYALSLWRNYGPEPWFIYTGGDMEARLWTDIAAFYHADLKNLCGPFDRAYGMDMQAYVSLVGLWLRTVLAHSLVPPPAPVIAGSVSGRRADNENRQVSRVPLPDFGVTSIRETCPVSSEDITPPSSLIRTHAPIPNWLSPTSLLPRWGSLCRLLPAPAATGIFPTLFLPVLLAKPGPLPRRLAGCIFLLLPLQHRPSPKELWVGVP